jgi:hypothetical protein
MSAFFKGVALLVAITCVVWIAVLWRWQATHRDMSVEDIVIYLGALPLVAFGFALALRWAWRGAADKQAARAAAQADASQAKAAGVAAAQADSSQDDARRHATVQLLAAHAACACGHSAEEVLAAAQEGKPRPEPNQELPDPSGQPVVCARMVDLDVQALSPPIEPMVQAVRAKDAQWAKLDPPVHVLRALAALAEPLARCVASLLPWAERLGAPQPNAAAPAARHDDAKGSTPQHLIRVLVAWPSSWTAFDQEVALGWVRLVLTEASGTPIPASRFAVGGQAGTGEELLLKADQLLQTLERERREDIVLVAACHSDLSEDAIALLDEQQRLFSAQTRPKGAMPGEGAAALVLAPATWPSAADQDEPAIHLHRPAVMRRDKSIEAAGRVSSDQVQQALTQALAASRVPAADIGALVCDADQHSARGTELFGATLSALAHLDPTEDMRQTGTVTGSLAAVGPLLVVAVAAALAKSSGKPCMAVSVGDPFLRLALVARAPGAAPAASAAA